jgi:hypothetical protein
MWGRRGRLGAVIIGSALALGACATVQPIYNVADVPVATAAGRQLSMTQVQTAIQRAGASLGWSIQVEAPGRLTGRYALRTHLAVVEIQHGTKSYSIRYRDSANLSARDGMIHSGYNQWVQSLDRSIKAELRAL